MAIMKGPSLLFFGGGATCTSIYFRGPFSAGCMSDLVRFFPYRNRVDIQCVQCIFYAINMFMYNTYLHTLNSG